jgi:hypothetical protein
MCSVLWNRNSFPSFSGHRKLRRRKNRYK